MPSDNFNRADGALGANWVVDEGSLVIESNKVRGTTDVLHVAHWITPESGANQWAEVVAQMPGTFDGGVGVCVRTTATQGYVYVSHGPSRYIYKNTGSGYGLVALGLATSIPIVTGDVLRLEVIGNKLRPTINGVLDPDIGEVLDSTIPSGGSAGLAIRFGLNYPTYIDSWTGGTLATHYAMDANPGSYAVTGKYAYIGLNLILEAFPSSYAVTGADADLAGPAVYLIPGSGAESQRTATTTPWTWTHTPAAGAPPDGIVVTVVHGGTSTDHVTAMTYGGVAMTKVVTAAHTTGEPGLSQIWFLGANIPPGPQTISATLATATGDDIHFVSNALYNDEHKDMEAVDSDFQVGILANPSRTLQYAGRGALAIGAFYGGANTPAFTPNANCVPSITWDMGNFYSTIFRQAAAGTADFTIGGTVASDDVAMAVAAFAAVGGASIAAMPASYSVAGFISTRAVARTALASSYGVTGSAATFALGKPINAVSGSYTLAGLAAELVPVRAVNAVSDSYAVTGFDAELVKVVPAIEMPALPGSYGLAGFAATTGQGRLLDAASSSYSTTGFAATTAWGRSFTAAPGAHTLTGFEAGLSKVAARELDATSGSYSTAGTVAGFTRALSLDAAASSYSIAGLAALLGQGHCVLADPAAYATTGAPSTFARGYAFPALPGTHAVTGQATSFLIGRALDAAPGVYAIAGFASTLQAGLSLNAGFGVYAVAGQASSLLADRAAPDPGFYEVAGQASSLLASKALVADSGIYATTGAPSTFAQGYILSALSGFYTVAGQASSVGAVVTLIASPGVYAIAGLPASLVVLEVGQFALTAEPGLYNITGTGAGFVTTRQLIVAPGSYALSGSVAGVVTARRLAVDPGLYAVAGQPAIFGLTPQLSAAPGIYAIFGNAAELLLVPLQTVGDGWRFTGERLRMPGLGAEAISRPTFSGETLRSTAMIVEEEVLV